MSEEKRYLAVVEIKGRERSLKRYVREQSAIERAEKASYDYPGCMCKVIDLTTNKEIYTTSQAVEGKEYPMYDPTGKGESPIAGGHLEPHTNPTPDDTSTKRSQWNKSECRGIDEVMCWSMIAQTLEDSFKLIITKEGQKYWLRLEAYKEAKRFKEHDTPILDEVSKRDAIDRAKHFMKWCPVLRDVIKYVYNDKVRQLPPYK